MVLVWGHNNFRLKSVDPTEIGLLDRSFSNYKFELRQKYGHLFWIPFIPLGKIWVVKKTDGKIYNCPDDIESRLMQQFPARNSLWAWTGPLLIIGGVILFGITNSIEDARSKARAKERYSQSNNEMLGTINNAKQNDYLMFSVKEKNSGYYDYRKIPLKVLSTAADSITLGVIYSPYEKEKTGTVKEDYSKARVVVEESVKTETGDYGGDMNISSEEDVARIELRKGIRDSFRIAKNDLTKSVCTEYGNEKDFQGIVIKNIASYGTCMLKEIWHIEGPLIKEAKMDAIERDGRYFELENKGFDAHADSIVSQEPGITWSISKKRDFNNGDVIAVKSNGKSKAILYCSDKKKNVFKYLVDNTEWRLMVSPIIE